MKNLFVPLLLEVLLRDLAPDAFADGGISGRHLRRLLHLTALGFPSSSATQTRAVQAPHSQPTPLFSPGRVHLPDTPSKSPGAASSFKLDPI